MIVLNLRCNNRHRFEGWFASNDTFLRQSTAGQVTCPICGNHEIKRLPSNPRIRRASSNVSSNTPTQPDETGAKAGPVADQMGSMLALMRHILEESEDVGERFPEEARRIHYDEAPRRTIRGLATPEDSAELEEEGIMVVSLPIPPTRDMH
jgi:hypothetical protein